MTPADEQNARAEILCTPLAERRAILKLLLQEMSVDEIVTTTLDAYALVPDRYTDLRLKLKAANYKVHR